MRVVLQRSKEAKVVVDGETVGKIDAGYVLMVGLTHDDTIEDLKYLADKVSNIRIFEDDAGKMNKSIKDVNGEILSISQFTLYGDVRKGRRPSFTNAAKPEIAEKLYLQFNDELRKTGLKVEEGIFGADMKVSLLNDGPVTILLDSKKQF